MYNGFRKIETDRWEFANEDFRRGNKHLLKNIHRRRSRQQIGTYAGSSSGETGKSGLEGEIQKLKHDKNLLMQEIINLQQEHLWKAHKVKAIKQRMEQAEQKQKQMVSFLAKVLQNSVFLSRFQGEITSPKVRRKFVKHKPVGENAVGTSMVEYKSEDKELTDNLGKLGAAAASMHDQNVNVASNELGQEFVGDLDQMGMGTLGLEPLGCEESAFKGEETGNPEPEVGTDCFASFLEDENIIKQEDIWSMGFDSGLSFPASSHDIWGDLANYDPHELGMSCGFSNFWNLGLQQVAGASVSDKWPSDEYGFDNLNLDK